MADQPKNFSGSVHFPMPHDAEPATAKQFQRRQLTEADTNRLREVLYQLKFNFGDQWQQKLVLLLDENEKSPTVRGFGTLKTIGESS